MSSFDILKRKVVIPQVENPYSQISQPSFMIMFAIYTTKTEDYKLAAEFLNSCHANYSTTHINKHSQYPG